MIDIRSLTAPPARLLRRGRPLLSMTLVALWPAGACGDGGASEVPGDGPMCPMDLPAATDCETEAPSYAVEIGPLIQRDCASCHFEGNTFSTQVFSSYEDVQAARRGMLTQIYACRMPPSEGAELSPEARAALLKWFVCGAPQN